MGSIYNTDATTNVIYRTKCWINRNNSDIIATAVLWPSVMYWIHSNVTAYVVITASRPTLLHIVERPYLSFWEHANNNNNKKKNDDDDDDDENLI